MLWRYMELAKFVFILQKSQLHCARGDQFDDKFEGSYPLKNKGDFENYGFKGEDWKKYVYVSCWHKSNCESDAMWRLYGLSKNGVAIITTEEILKKLGDDSGYYLEKVKYIDFTTETGDINIPTDVYHYKRRSFIHESEFRLIKTHYPSKGFANNMPIMSLPMKGSELSPKGELLDLDLNEFIVKVVVSPYSDRWFYDVVVKLAESYGLNKECIHVSELIGDPIYSK
jgi:hypothetical protein